MTAIEIQNRDPQPVLSIRRTTPMASLVQTQGESLHRLWSLLRDRGVTPAGPPFVRYHSVEEEKTDVEIGVPVPGGVTGEGPIVAGRLPGGQVIVTVHLGGHDRLSEAYQRIEEWPAARNGPGGGPAWEVYEWIDLSTEPDPSSWPAPADWRTQIVQPVR